MIGLTLRDVEQELLEIADDDEDDGWSFGTSERLRTLARRIAVQIETDKLARAA
jgi:hypothetical protein